MLPLRNSPHWPSWRVSSSLVSLVVTIERAKTLSELSAARFYGDCIYVVNSGWSNNWSHTAGWVDDSTAILTIFSAAMIRHVGKDSIAGAWIVGMLSGNLV